MSGGSIFDKIISKEIPS